MNTELNISEIQGLIKRMNGFSFSRSPYGYGKEVIIKVFSQTSGEVKNDVITRLILIDSIYSTNVNGKRYYGIEELADAIICIDNLPLKLNQFLTKQASSEDIAQLFNKKFGIKKDGGKFGKAPALLSKYFHFVASLSGECENGFPIYDSLVVEMLPKVCNLIGAQIESKKLKELPYYFNLLSSIADTLEMTSSKDAKKYNVLDEYLWMMAKVSRGSFAPIMDRSSYSAFISSLDLKKKKDKESEKEPPIENQIIKKIKEEKNLCSLFPNDNVLLQLIEHAKKLYI